MPQCQRDILLQGAALFNDGDFFEAHEVWEQAWRRAQGDARELLQGLIQAAAALLHLQRNNLKGAYSLCEKSLSHLRNLPDHYADLDLGRFCAQLRATIESALTSGTTRRSPALPKLAFAPKAYRLQSVASARTSISSRSKR